MLVEWSKFPECRCEWHFTINHLWNRTADSCAFTFRPDPSKICINIGLDYYIEYTLPEALVHIERRMKKLNKSANQLATASSKIKAHIKTVLEVSGQILE